MTNQTWSYTGDQSCLWRRPFQECLPHRVLDFASNSKLNRPRDQPFARCRLRDFVGAENPNSLASLMAFWGGVGGVSSALLERIDRARAELQGNQFRNQPIEFNRQNFRSANRSIESSPETSSGKDEVANTSNKDSEFCDEILKGLISNRNFENSAGSKVSKGLHSLQRKQKIVPPLPVSSCSLDSASGLEILETDFHSPDNTNLVNSPQGSDRMPIRAKGFDEWERTDRVSGAITSLSLSLQQSRSAQQLGADSAKFCSQKLSQDGLLQLNSNSLYRPTAKFATVASIIEPSCLRCKGHPVTAGVLHRQRYHFSQFNSAKCSLVLDAEFELNWYCRNGSYSHRCHNSGQCHDCWEALEDILVINIWHQMILCDARFAAPCMASLSKTITFCLHATCLMRPLEILLPLGFLPGRHHMIAVHLILDVDKI